MCELVALVIILYGMGMGSVELIIASGLYAIAAGIFAVARNLDGKDK